MVTMVMMTTAVAMMSMVTMAMVMMVTVKVAMVMMAMMMVVVIFHNRCIMLKDAISPLRNDMHRVFYYSKAFAL